MSVWENEKLRVAECCRRLAKLICTPEFDKLPEDVRWEIHKNYAMAFPEARYEGKNHWSKWVERAAKRWRAINEESSNVDS